MKHGKFKAGMIILMQHDLKAAIEFYQKLGMTLKFHLEEKWAEFDLGCTKLGLCPIEKAQGDFRTGFVLETDEDLKALHAKLKSEGFEFLNEPVTAPHGIMVAFKDPGGNIIDLYQATPENLKDFVDKTGEKADQAAEDLKAEKN